MDVCIGCRSSGILCLTFAFFWQLYTLWLLTQLHESVPGTRYCRYLQLAKAAFGKGKPPRRGIKHHHPLGKMLHVNFT